jgi:Zn-dependent protease
MEETQVAEIAAIILALGIAIIGHEIMHGRIAYYYGDSTAKQQGRLSINPLVHIDPVGTIIVPALLYFSDAGFLFGWAKPVPIHIPTVIRNGGYNGAIAVSLAGIIFNFTMAIGATIILHLLSPIDNIWNYFLHAFLTYTIVYNVVLGLFNLLPIPPLDGSHVVVYQAKKMGYHTFANKFQAIGQYGMILLILIIATPLADIIFMPMMKIINLLLP